VTSYIGEAWVKLLCSDNLSDIQTENGDLNRSTRLMRHGAA